MIKEIRERCDDPEIYCTFIGRMLSDKKASNHIVVAPNHQISQCAYAVQMYI